MSSLAAGRAPGWTRTVTNHWHSSHESTGPRHLRSSHMADRVDVTVRREAVRVRREAARDWRPPGCGVPARAGLGPQVSHGLGHGRPEGEFLDWSLKNLEHSDRESCTAAWPQAPAQGPGPGDPGRRALARSYRGPDHTTGRTRNRGKRFPAMSSKSFPSESKAWPGPSYLCQ